MSSQERFAPKDESRLGGRANGDEVEAQKVFAEGVAEADSEATETFEVAESFPRSPGVHEDVTLRLETMQTSPMVAETQVLEGAVVSPAGTPTHSQQREAQGQPDSAPAARGASQGSPTRRGFSPSGHGQSPTIFAHRGPTPSGYDAAPNSSGHPSLTPSGYSGAPSEQRRMSAPPQGYPQQAVQPKKVESKFKTRFKSALESLMQPPVFWVVLGVAAAVGVLFGVLLGASAFGGGGKVSALEAELGAQQGELADWKSRLTEVQKENESLSAEVKKVDQREKELDAREEELAAREEEAAERAAELAAAEEQVAERENAVSGAEAEVAKNSFGAGMYLVGSDIQPGTYRADGGDFCYWERLSGTGGSFSEIIANDFSDGPSIVTISPSDVAFDSSGCGTWTPAN